MTPPDVRSDRTRPTQSKAEHKTLHRTSLRKLVTLNNTLSDEKKKVVESMGFGSLLELKIKVFDNAMMGCLIKKIDSSSCILEVCGKSIHITLDKVKSAFGIPCTDKNFTNIEGSNKGWSRYEILFQGSEGNILDLAALELKLTKCESAGADFKVMYMLFLCTIVLLPKYGTSLELGLLDYLVDLNDIHTYNWGGIVFKSLVDGVENHRRKNTTKVTGCIFLLQEESVTTRRKLASHLFYHSQNLVRPRDPISVWVTPLPDKETCHRVPREYNANELTLGGILKEVYKVWAEDASGDTIGVKDDEHLQKLAESHLKNYDPGMHIELAWNLKEEKGYMDGHK